MTNRDHNRLLSIFFFIQGGLQLFAGIVVALVYGGMGTFIASQANEPEAAGVAGVMVVLGVLIGLLCIVFAGFYLFTGWKMHKGSPTGRILGIIASCLCLPGFPLGTALGIYGLWFFFGDGGKSFYGTDGAAPVNAPQPNSWK